MDDASELLAGRYELGPTLGRGGMGEVRSAVDHRLSRTVAVKLLHQGVDPSARQRFEDEAMAAAQLVHPNVVGVFDTGEHDGVAYIVMERLPGRTLADEIATGPLPIARVRAVADQVLRALEAAHDAGIIHRDIKPGNVLLTDDGTAKVADFGIAKMEEGNDHTATGMVIGTPSYLAPERILGQPATAQSDVYAVGVVLHEALTGDRPFDDPSPVAAADAARCQEPPSLELARPDADAALVRAIERSMAKQPGDRFQTAAAMRSALEEGVAAPVPGTTVLRTAAPATAVLPITPAPAPAASSPEGHVQVPPGAVGTSPPSDGPAPRGTIGFAPARSRRPSGTALAALGAGVVVLILVVLLLVGGGDDEPTAPPTGPELPAELEARLRSLEEAVQP